MQTLGLTKKTRYGVRQLGIQIFEHSPIPASCQVSLACDREHRLTALLSARNHISLCLRYETGSLHLLSELTCVISNEEVSLCRKLPLGLLRHLVCLGILRAAFLYTGLLFALPKNPVASGSSLDAAVWYLKQSWLGAYHVKRASDVRGAHLVSYVVVALLWRLVGDQRASAFRTP